MTLLSILAQIPTPTPPAEVFGTWLFNLGMSMGILYMVVKLISGILHLAKPRPPLEGTYVTKAEHTAAYDSLKIDIRDLARKQTENTHGTHERIDKILAAVSGLEGEMKHIRGGLPR